MSKTNNGGAAFPSTSDNGYGVMFTEHGMTLRDYFAGQAIGAVIRQCSADSMPSIGSCSVEQYFADKALAIADAMLKAREA